MVLQKDAVVIVGRPNVGKSSLFNRILGHRHTIVEATSGVTRDRIYKKAAWKNFDFTLIDTGGIILRERADLSVAVIDQVVWAIETSELIVLVLDAQTGLVPADIEILNFLRRFGKKIIVAVNKVDDISKLNLYSEFYELGAKDIYFVSALHANNIEQLKEAISSAFSKLHTQEKVCEEYLLKIAIIGRPNVGKSSFLNRILKEERVIVDERPGTTRDAVDTTVEFGGHKIVLIDTAGISAKKKIKDNIDFYSRSRTISAVRRADVCIVMVDAKCGIQNDDLQIFRLIKDEYKPCVIAINKSDLIKIKLSDCIRTINQKAAFIDFAHIVLCSAKENLNLEAAIELAIKSRDNAKLKVKQKDLNETIAHLKQRIPQLSRAGKLKINYLTQTDVLPPKFILLVNHPSLVKDDFIRCIENDLRRRFGFNGVPIQILIREKKKQKEG
ncbi:MAG: ribosome biogenesis GTPase Der [Candidatus Omnitrophica bacterium]|nr:ribosome biogenesis GTPase Der [Candidatus Omnitrophota bacterium]MBU1924782.1 ribosome biogenesis GTPase Der [Candidatus Omnitrophota bacterium]